MHVELHHTVGELIRTERRARVAARLSAVRLAVLGRTAAQVGEQGLLGERAVRGWVARYNAGGTDALADRPGRGRKSVPPPPG